MYHLDRREAYGTMALRPLALVGDRYHRPSLECFHRLRPKLCPHYVATPHSPLYQPRVTTGGQFVFSRCLSLRACCVTEPQPGDRKRSQLDLCTRGPHRRRAQQFGGRVSNPPPTHNGTYPAKGEKGPHPSLCPGETCWNRHLKRTLTSLSLGV